MSVWEAAAAYFGAKSQLFPTPYCCLIVHSDAGRLESHATCYALQSEYTVDPPIVVLLLIVTQVDLRVR